MKLKYGLCGSLAFLASIAFFSCSGDKETKREIIRPVRWQQVFLSGGEQSRTLSGVSKAGTEARLSVRVGGIVEAVNVKVGEQIAEGKLIASIDDSDARINYEKVLVALRRTDTQKDIAKSTLDRVKGLYENNSVSLSEYEAAKDKYASANSAYNTEKQNADLRKRELGYYKLYAPMDGIIAEVDIEKNEQVSPGQTMVVISAKDDIEVSVGMPEAFIGRIKPGEQVSVKFPSIPGKSFDGVISEVSFAAGSESSTYPVIVTVKHPTSAIRPGMTADVTFNVTPTDGLRRSTLVVPANAVGEDTDGNFVFVVTESENGLAAVQKKTVTVGTLTSNGFEIVDGLQDGDFVVTAGIANLSDGMKVRLLK